MTTRVQDSLMQGQKRLRKVIGIAFCCTIALYLAAFFLSFEILSPPVRTPDRWLGPRLRFDSTVVDIGNVWHTDEPNHLYMVYRPPCALWSAANGL
jgi:hypothetical protein